MPPDPTVEVPPVIRPNPYNLSASIQYELPSSARVTLEIFDVNGRRVRTLVDGEQQARGPHVIEWKADDDRGVRVSSGVYFCRLQAGSSMSTAKLVLVK